MKSDTEIPTITQIRNGRSNIAAAEHARRPCSRRTTRRLGVAAAAIAAAGVMLSASSIARVAVARADTQSLSPVAQAGHAFFLDYCAACHGTEARGDGPVGEALASRPADLTEISKRRDGRFPTEELLEFIDGRSMLTAHGAREMPVWGDRFETDEGEGVLGQRRARGRLLMILVYLEAVQR